MRKASHGATVYTSEPPWLSRNVKALKAPGLPKNAGWGR